MAKKKKTKEEKLGCLWEVLGYLLLFISLIWVIGNKEKIGTFGTIAYIIVAIVVISALKVKSGGGRQPAKIQSAKKIGEFAEVTEGEKTTISRLPKYNPEKDLFAKKHFPPQFIEIIKKGWTLILDKESISMLDKNGEEVYTLRYDQIVQITATCGAISPRGKSAKDMLPFPSWAYEFKDESITMIAERAGLEMAKGKIYRKVKPRQIETKYYSLPPKPILPKAEKILEGEKLIISRLPAYDPEKDSFLSRFNPAEKEIIKNITQLVVDIEELFMVDEEGKRVYEIRYEEIDKIMHRERANPVFIYALNKKSYSDRIPFPTWSSKFDSDILEVIAERANLEEKITTQEFRGTTVKSSYYGRKN